MLYLTIYSVCICSTFVFAVWLLSIIFPEYGGRTAIAFFSSSMFVASLLPYFILGNVFDYYPPVPNTNLSTDSYSDTLQKFEQRTIALTEQFNKPKEMTISELENALAETLKLTQDFAPIISQQNQEIQLLKAEVESERERASEARQLAAEIQSLTKEQISAVKLLITEDARESSQESFFLGIAISFPLGIIASLVASWLFSKFSITK